MLVTMYKGLKKKGIRKRMITLEGAFDIAIRPIVGQNMKLIPL